MRSSAAAPVWVAAAHREAPTPRTLPDFSSSPRRLQPLIGLPGVKREAAAVVSRAAPTLLALLQAPGAGCDAAALGLVGALLETLPSSLRPHAAAVETALVRTVLSAAEESAGGEQARLAAAAARALARMPLVTGDAAAWSDCVRRCLSSAHDCLDAVYMGLEPAGGSEGARARSSLAPAAASQARAARPPPPLRAPLRPLLTARMPTPCRR